MSESEDKVRRERQREIRRKEMKREWKRIEHMYTCSYRFFTTAAHSHTLTPSYPHTLTLPVP